MNQLRKNLGYQTVYQLLNTILPLITSPYLARVLGAEAQGVFSFTQSVVNYFTLFAMLGVVNYGTRTIAACAQNRDDRSCRFWEVYALQLITSILAIVLYGIYCIFVDGSNSVIVWIQGLYLLGALVDVSWLFFGVERFKTTVKRSVVVRLISVTLILLLVKSPSDLWIYALIMSGGTFLSSAVLWGCVPKIVEFRSISRVNLNGIMSHIKPNLVLFIPMLAMSVYHIMDKTMLGILSTYEQSGFYYNADKVINIPACIITGVGTVMLPRMTAVDRAGKKGEFTKVFNHSLQLVAVSSIAMAFGISAIATEFTPLFFGKGFDPCINLMIVLSPVLVIKGFSQTSRMQFLIPKQKEYIYIQSVFAGALVNFVVNALLIPKLGAMGAVVGTLIAEFVSCVWQYIGMSRFIDCKKTMVKALIYLGFGMLMFIGVRFVANFLKGGITGVIVEVLIGMTIYGGLCIGFWYATKDEMFWVIVGQKRSEK